MTTRPILDDGFGTRVVGWVGGDLAVLEVRPDRVPQEFDDEPPPGQVIARVVVPPPPPPEPEEDWEWEIAVARARAAEPSADLHEAPTVLCPVTPIASAPRLAHGTRPTMDIPPTGPRRTVLPVPALPVQSENCRVRLDDHRARRVELPRPLARAARR